MLWKEAKSVENLVDYAENPYFVDFIRLFSYIYANSLWKTFHPMAKNVVEKVPKKVFCHKLYKTY